MGLGPPSLALSKRRGIRQNVAATRAPTARKRVSSPTTTLPLASRASPGAGSAGTSLWRWPRLCSRVTQFSAQFPTLIPPSKIKPGSQAKAGRAAGPLATHADAIGGTDWPLGAGLLLPVRDPPFRATSRGTPGPAAPKTSAAKRRSPTRRPRPIRRGGVSAVISALSRSQFASAATVPSKQIQTVFFPLLFSWSASSPGSPHGAGGRRGAGGTASPTNPTQTW